MTSARRQHWAAILTIALFTAMGAGYQPVHAQAVTAAATAPEGLEEIVVTAERRSENLQTTSIAISALSGEDIAQKGVRDQTDLQFATPALSMTQVGFTENVNIRGIGINLQSPVVVSGVALYRDGLFYPGNIMADEPYYDVKDVEVLRGPQGTFVGQNSTGGALLVTSNNPSLDGEHANVELQLGNYQDVQVRGAINIPLNDAWAARVAFNHESRNSFFNDINSRLVQPGKEDQSNIRFSLLFSPGESFSALWKSEYNTNSTDGYPQRPIPGTAYASLAPANLWDLNYDRDDVRNDERSIRSGLELKYKFDGGISVRSISGFQYGQLNMMFDEDATLAPTASSTLPGSYQPQVIHERVTTQEIDVLSPDSGVFRWVAGGTYMHRDVPVEFTTYTQAGASNPLGFAPGTITQEVAIALNNPSDTYGVFGQGTYELTDALEVVAGARYSHDWIGSAGTLGVFVNIPGPGLIQVVSSPNATPFSDQKVTGKVAVNWKLDANNFIYAFAANGYKSGGPNPFNTAVFQPESVWDYELGLKSTLADGHIRTQIDGFYMDYDNFQYSVLNPITTGQTVVNLQGTSKIYGAELQMQGRAGPWAFDLSGAYVHATLGSAQLIDPLKLPNGGTGLGVQCAPGVASGTNGCFDYTPYFQNIAGAENPYSPEYTADIGVQYDLPLVSGTLTPRVDFSYTGSQRASVFQDQLFLIPPRHLLNAQLTYQHKAWRLTAYGTNLTNLTYETGQQGPNEFLGAARQYGLRYSMDF